MDFREKDGKLILTLEGRIDTGNAAKTEQEITEIISSHPGMTPAFDAKDLAYISSAGLRVLMKIRKQVGVAVEVLDVSPEVYDIFETTGFTELLSVTKKLRELSVDGCEKVGEGANGAVYRLDDETIIKVFSAGVPMKTVQEERDFARAAFVAGVPTAISYDVVKVGDCYGAVYEMLHAKTLATVIMENKDRAEEFGSRMGELIKDMHHTSADTKKLNNLLEIYKDRSRRMEKYLSSKELEKLCRVYDALDERTTLVHGDYHCKNIMYMNDELIFIDMGDVGYGHPLLDLGGTYLAMERIRLRRPEVVAHYIGLEPEVCKRVYDAMMLAYFGEKDVAAGRELVRIYGEAKYTITPLVYSKATDELAKQMVESMRVDGFISDGFDITPAFNRSIAL